MSTGSNDPHAQPSPAQAKPQLEPQTDKHPQPLPQVNVRQATKWPNYPPRPEVLLAAIKKLSIERRISYMDHGEFRFETRFVEMGFDVFDMYYVLEHGLIDGKIEAGKKQGEWKTKIVCVPEGTSRKMGVVTIVAQERRLLIKTVEWEDR
jgi:hypothetical protein